MAIPFGIKESDYKSAIPSDIKVISVFLRGDAIEICMRIDIISELSPICLHYDISQMIDSTCQPERIIAHLASCVQEFRQ